jgi:hypothetical protein
MASTHMVLSPSHFTLIARRGAAGLALAALLAAHIATPGSALAGGCGTCDDDFDGLTNSEEIGFGTDLSNPDTDFDGASDLDEIVFLYTNPLVPDQSPAGSSPQNNPGYDYDGDGLGAYDEQTYGTNVELADTDGDGLNDGDEVFYYRTSPLYADSDGDSYGDGYELAVGYDPLNAYSIPPAPTSKG